ncbi:hypothetical protein LTR66_013633 [Elasticomyces elasticus]|nr:hypothetical protein LTR66_013633 [Elasticomyces elasticus]
MDVESSFLPEPLFAHTGDTRAGADDTYVQLGSPGHTPPPEILFLGLDSELSNAPGELLDRSADGQEAATSSTPAHTYESPATTGNDSSPHDTEEPTGNEVGAESPTRDDDPSSPAAAAAARTHSRTVSSASTERVSRARAEPTDIDSGNSSPMPRSAPGTPPRSNSVASTIRVTSSPRPQDVGLPPSEADSMLSLNGVHSMSPTRLQKRPSYLVNRQMSQRSSASSQTLSSEQSGSDVAVSADYALQTGGAITAQHSIGSGSRPNMGLSRLPSLGSVASFMSKEDEPGMPTFSGGASGASLLASLRSDRNLSSLVEERGQSQSPPATPRPTTAHSLAPTDTVIAQHVQSINVPDTIAKQFRQMQRSVSPDKRFGSSGMSLNLAGGRARVGLPLKEQNAKIDKLTKENFDLKLKIHFLDQALQSRSDEGVKEMISKNVQLQTDLANERKDNQSMRRKMRELEKKLQSHEGLAEARQSADESESKAEGASQDDLQEEILYLREQLDFFERQTEELREENMTKEVERRRLVEYVSAMGDRRSSEPRASDEEAIEIWKDQAASEMARREKAEADVQRLREELVFLRTEKSSNPGSMNKTPYNSNKRHQFSRQQSTDNGSDFSNARNGTMSGSSATLVDQLKYENAELRRDLGAQTSMLTSRNRERERLQQEIEDLKMLQRKSDGSRSMAGDSIFERSISRAHQHQQHQRSASRASQQTGFTQASDAERDAWERKEGQLRDDNATLRLQNQQLEQELNTHLDELTRAEEQCRTLQTELETATEDLLALQTERDDCVRAYDERVSEFHKLKDEAVVTVEGLEDELEQRSNAMTQLEMELRNRNEDFHALQREMRELSQALRQLEDDREASSHKIEQLEQEMEDLTLELNGLDKKLREANQKNQKLDIQSESLHSEVKFLREEQEGDKIRIGELQGSLNAAEQTIQDEKDKLQELEESLVEERRQREIINDESKQEVQKILDDLNAENTRAKDEVRRLHRSVSSKEVEAATWKTKLEELEGSLRHTLGDPQGTRTSLLNDIQQLQNDLDNTIRELDKTKGALAEKDRILRNRDQLLEDTSLESRRLSDLLEKERADHRHMVEQVELAQRGHTTSARSIAKHESRVLELETLRSQDRRKMAALEQQYRDQLMERNNLLFALWNRLSTLCGANWASSNSLVNGQVPSLDVIARDLIGFNNLLFSAVKTVEGLIGGFKARIRSIEKELFKDFQTLEHNLDLRVKRIDALEHAFKDAQLQIEAQASALEAQAALRPSASRSPSSSSKTLKQSEEIAILKESIKQLKAELKFHRQNPSAAAQQMLQQQQRQAADQSRRQSNANSTLSPARAIAATLLRHHSSSAVETLHSAQKAGPETPAQQHRQPIVLHTPPIQPSEQRWIHRLKELERRLKAEREARLLDRSGARKRLEEGRAENEELRMQLEREKERREGSVAGSSRRGSELD